MAMTYTIDATRRIVFTTMTGMLSFDQVVAHAVALKSDPCFHPSFSELLDLRGVSQSDLTLMELIQLADTIDPFSSNARRAIITGSDSIYETSRMYQAVREQENNIRLFRSIEEAQPWLGIEGGAIEERQTA
jgi:hypothetical protein